jgi:hypothetical protein
METYEPIIVNPYPDEPWSAIADFVYATPLYLYRAIEAVQRREGDDADYIVARPYTVRFKLDGSEREITVPRGMVTDLASVPRIAWSIVNRVGPHLEASIMHDFLYIAWQSLPGRDARDADREFADKLLRVAMEEAGVGALKKALIYNTVRTFGGGTYRRRDPVRYVRIPPDGV